MNKDSRRECYWCGLKRDAKRLRRTTLAGPARRQIYECCEAVCRMTIKLSISSMNECAIFLDDGYETRYKVMDTKAQALKVVYAEDSEEKEDIDFVNSLWHSSEVVSR